MPRRLFEVEIEGKSYVWAEDEHDARQLAERNINVDHLDVSVIDSDGIPDDELIPYMGWATARPYAKPQIQRTVKELMDEIRAKREEARKERAAREYNEKFQVKLTDICDAEKK